MTAVKDRHSIDRIIHDQADALHGFTVRTIDGEAGTVAKDQSRVDDGHLLIHINAGVLGLKRTDVVVESDAIDVIDAAEKLIHIDRITDWVKASPKVDQYVGDHPEVANGHR